VDKLIIGAFQGYCTDGDLAANLARTQRAVDEAADAGCDFLCMPEQFLAGCGGNELLLPTAMTLDDPRLLGLAEHAGRRSVVTLVGLIEKRGAKYANTQAILAEGKVLGHYTKTMLVGGDRQIMDNFYDDDLPVFHAKGVCFGVQICHDSSFPEVAATLAWKGARIVFSPHFNSIRRDLVPDHMTLVRNNHVGTAAHYGLVLVRSNVVGHWADGDRYGYGDSAIFAPNGRPIAEAGLFAERLITADVAPYLKQNRWLWRDRRHLRPAVIRQLNDAANAALQREDI
jgi:predicted amidohydrolase